ncbi:MAG: Crp/Fnr family transcriptional regulator [Firmicutes bacterium]|nr:Crp/Fnr family transcriptional regulator [Bacillota bacterium]
MEVMEVNIAQYLDVLLNTDLFAGFTREDLQRLFAVHNFGIRDYAGGQVIYVQGELCRSMDIILAGRVSVQRIDEEGNILKVAVFATGDLVGANLLFSQSNLYPMTIVAEEKTVILHLYKELILGLGQSSKSFMAELLAVVANKTLLLTDKIHALSLKTIRQQVCDFLQYEYHVQKSDVLELKISKKELAQRMGVHRTSLSRELNKMRREGLIDYDARTITLRGLKEKMGKRGDK